MAERNLSFLVDARRQIGETMLALRQMDIASGRNQAEKDLFLLLAGAACRFSKPFALWGAFVQPA